MRQRARSWCCASSLERAGGRRISRGRVPSFKSRETVLGRPSARLPTGTPEGGARLSSRNTTNGIDGARPPPLFIPTIRISGPSPFARKRGMSPFPASFCQLELKLDSRAPIQLLPGPAPAQRRIPGSKKVGMAGGRQTFAKRLRISRLAPPPSPTETSRWRHVTAGQLSPFQLKRRPIAYVDDSVSTKPGTRIGGITLEPGTR